MLDVSRTRRTFSQETETLRSGLDAFQTKSNCNVDAHRKDNKCRPTSSHFVSLKLFVLIYNIYIYKDQHNLNCEMSKEKFKTCKTTRHKCFAIRTASH